MDANLQEFTNPVLYDAENSWGVEDDFYLALAEQVGGPVLDVACGTGRLARGMAEAGLQVTGLYVVAAMVGRARLLARDLPITWVEADCRAFSLGQRFRCVLMTGHAFQNLLTDADQDAFLECVADHLQVGGTFAFETRNLHGRNYGSASDPTLWKSFQDPDGPWIEVWVASRFDAETGTDQVELLRKVRGTGDSWKSRIALRYTGVEELNHRLAARGLEVVEQYGDWEKSPCGPASPEIITICRR